MTNESAEEMEVRHLETCEQIRQKLTEDRALWEGRASSHSAAPEMTARLDEVLRLNAQLLHLAKQRLAYIQAQKRS